MSAVPTTQPLTERRRFGDRFGDLALQGLTAAAALAAAVLLGAIAWKVFETAWPAITKYGVSFITHQGWDVGKNQFAALDFIWAPPGPCSSRCPSPRRFRSALASSLARLPPPGIRWFAPPLLSRLRPCPALFFA